MPPTTRRVPNRKVRNSMTKVNKRRKHYHTVFNSADSLAFGLTADRDLARSRLSSRTAARRSAARFKFRSRRCFFDCCSAARRCFAASSLFATVRAGRVFRDSTRPRFSCAYFSLSCKVHLIPRCCYYSCDGLEACSSTQELMLT